ncbi:MAG TPA: SDR family NAD(P)-dependent oxidoreductase, partial [Pseudobdellovibrionaceae bacterium]|nr:SDR family NAD(P)-dependent oxidoreductase [Pseudobdellovibrionaceae bacterium]
MLRRFLNFLINKSVGSKETQLQEYKPVILVTGCSSGIGLSLARVLLKHPQYRIVITARNIDSLRLEFAESERLLLRNLDVGIEQARIDLVNEVKTLWGGVDILINNAGVSYRAVMEHMTEEDEYKQMNSNYFGPIGLIRLVLPGMRERGRGKIINV